MNILLKPYQDTAVARCHKEIARSVEDWQDAGEASAVSLSAFTSAGKTIIATALLERMRFGDGTSHMGESDFTVLWVTNSPSLNSQTMKKMLATSRFKDDDLVEIDEDVRGSSLTPGKVYFLNTQKLSKTASKYRASEARPVSLEQMIRNTVARLGTKFMMVIDEAHIGTSRDERGGQPIAYRLMNGQDGVGKFPVVLGLSATPQRFQNGIKDTGRILRSIEVPVKDIRESGLIKDRLLAHVPTEGEYVESKLMREAVSTWAESDTAWQALHESDKHSYPLVKPLLLVQVEPGIADARIAEILADLRGLDERLDGIAVAHAFGEKAALTTPRGDKVAYIAPEDIQETTYVRAVLFKDALTTGWDCPRAEVLISLRTAKDMTYVKQMIGRMVRTPLAQKVDGHPFLNDVTMYLPHYDLETIEQVRNDLQGDTDESVATEVVTRPVDLHLASGISGVPDGEALTQDSTVVDRMRMIKSHKRPKRRRGPVPRLAELARLLETTGVLKAAEKSADRALASAMLEVYEGDKDSIEASALGRAATKVAVVDIGDGLGGVKDVTSGDIVREYAVEGLPSQEEASRRFEEAKRTCGAGAALEQVWQQLAGEDPTVARFSDPDAHVESQLVATEVGLLDGMRDTVNTAAQAKFDAWVSAHGVKLQFAARDAYVELMAAAGVSIPVPMAWPLVLRGERDSDILAVPGHVYVRMDGEYPLPKTLNAWETETVDAIKKMSNCIGWWRNPTGGDNALGVRYTSTSGEARTVYPDFLGVFRDGDTVRFGVFDPHEDAHDGQSRTKWLGIAEYLRADYNLDEDGNRIIDTAWAIVRPGQGLALRAVDLADDDVVEMLKDANIDLIAEVFGTKGFTL